MGTLGLQGLTMLCGVLPRGSAAGAHKASPEVHWVFGLGPAPPTLQLLSYCGDPLILICAWHSVSAGDHRSGPCSGIHGASLPAGLPSPGTNPRPGCSLPIPSAPPRKDEQCSTPSPGIAPVFLDDCSEAVLFSLLSSVKRAQFLQLHRSLSQPTFWNKSNCGPRELGSKGPREQRSWQWKRGRCPPVQACTPPRDWEVRGLPPAQGV